ncbi:T9SS type A sorting domain-containing protein [Tamlana crocina]|uniref:T9SS type A sorting domain-containing protein n=1 Tax=Tamlana crocina TaxID=393006 RepID=UPI001FD7FF98|nr:T9SS type A sorting domain-containing protein [Tamlana crocina]
MNTTAIINTDFDVLLNPSTKRVSVQLPSLTTNILIYNIQGRQVKTYYPTEKTFQFSVETYQKGLYFVEVNLNYGSRISKKLIIY